MAADPRSVILQGAVLSALDISKSDLPCVGDGRVPTLLFGNLSYYPVLSVGLKTDHRKMNLQKSPPKLRSALVLWLSHGSV